MIAVIVGVILSWLVPCVQVQGMRGVFVPAGVVRVKVRPVIIKYELEGKV